LANILLQTGFYRLNANLVVARPALRKIDCFSKRRHLEPTRHARKKVSSTKIIGTKTNYQISKILNAEKDFEIGLQLCL
jgi:hypothetical protein